MDYDFGSDFDLGSFEDLDLSGLDLSGLENLDLSGLDLSGLEGLDLSGIDLGSLENMDIGGMDLSGLEGVDFGGGGDGVVDMSGLSSLEGAEGLDLNSLDELLRSMGDQGIEGMEDIEFGDARVLADMGDFDRLNTYGMSANDESGSKFDGAGQPDNPLYSDTTEELQPWQNLEGSGTTQLSDAYSYKDGKWSVRGYYDEETGRFIPDPNGPLTNPLDETSGTNLKSMDGYTYDKKTGTWTTPQGNTYTPKTAPSHTAKSGAQVMVDAGALPPGYAGLTPGKGSTAANSGSGSGSGSGNKSGTGEKKDDFMKYIMLLMALDAMRNKGDGKSGAVIPNLVSGRGTTRYGDVQKAPGYRPGQGGVQYFGPTVYRAAGGGIGALDAAGGRLLRGPGDGVSDDIVAQIGNNQPARLADGEYVLDARTVSEVGNGSTEAGAKKIAEMVERVHSERRNAKRGKPSNADRKLLA